MARTQASLKADRNFKAMGSGERTSKKVAVIQKKDGTSFRRKNANQFGEAEGGNDYTEKRVNRTDRFAKGGKTKKEPVVVYTQFEEENYEYSKGGKAGEFCYEIGGL